MIRKITKRLNKKKGRYQPVSPVRGPGSSRLIPKARPAFRAPSYRGSFSVKKK